MKKESKGRYKISEQLNSKTTSLIMIVSGISVLLLMVYFGVSLTSKGTFSADGTYTCSTGTLVESGQVHVCCPSGFTTGITNYHGDAWCYNNRYPVAADDDDDDDDDENNIQYATSSAYCTDGVVLDPMDSLSLDNCINNGGYVENGKCYLPCAVDSLSQATPPPVVCTYGSLTGDSRDREVFGALGTGEDAAACCPDGWRPSQNGLGCVTSIHQTYIEANGREYVYYTPWVGSNKCVNFDNRTFDVGMSGNCEEINCPCSIDGSCQGQDFGGAQRCYKTSDNPDGVLVSVDRCSLSSDEASRAGHCGNFENTIQGTCNITKSDGTTVSVPRCSLDAVSTCPTQPSTKTCYKCVADSTTPSSQQVNASDNCPSGWSTTEPTCSKTCKYCSNGQVKTNSNVPKETACSDYNANYHESSESLTCDTTKKTCYKCVADSTTPSSQQVNASDNCPSGWSTTVPTCSKTCKYCSNGQVKTNSNVPKETACSDYNANYHESSESLTCDITKKTCYKCVADSTTPSSQQVNASDNCPSGWSATVPTCSKTCKYCSNGQVKTNSNVPKETACSDYSANYHESSESLTCIEETKCCVCNGNTKVTKGDSTNGKCPSGQTVCSQLVCKNEQTGSTAIVIAWIVGILAIGYSFYYFRQTSKQK